MINSKQKDIIIKLVLVIIIIILLLHNCYMINKDKKKLIPTGNVDVIEIKCDKDDTCKVEPQEPDENNTEPVNKIDDYYSEMDNLIIDKNDKPDDANKQKNDNKKEEKQD